MTRDEIMALANQTAGQHWMDEAHIQRFAALVAAAERNDCIAIIENERHFWSHQDAIDVCNLAIDSIRARNNK